MCYGAESTYLTAIMEALAAAGEAAASTEGVAAAGAAAGAGAAGAAGAGATAAGLTAAELAAMEAAGTLGGLAPEAWAGAGGMGVAQNGISAGLASAPLSAQAAGAANNPASLLSSQGLLANAGKSLMSGGSGDMSKMLMAQQGLGLLGPQTAAPPPAPMPQGGQQQPLASPYGRNKINSMDLPPPGMSMEEWLKRKQMMGGY